MKRGIFLFIVSLLLHAQSKSDDFSNFYIEDEQVLDDWIVKIDVLQLSVHDKKDFKKIESSAIKIPEGGFHVTEIDDLFSIYVKELNLWVNSSEVTLKSKQDYKVYCSDLLISSDADSSSYASRGVDLASCEKNQDE